MQFSLEQIQSSLALGGPVVMVLLAASVLSLAVALTKYLQMSRARVGQHRALKHALHAWNENDRKKAIDTLQTSRSYLAPLIASGMHAEGTAKLSERLEAEAESKLLPLERGLRFLDVIAQLSPLLGLFGTVLGMIEAFQALQDAGSQVDPSILAGGIWVALMTTAAGLAVAMPTSVVLAWFESRIDRERVFIGQAIMTITAPGLGRT